MNKTKHTSEWQPIETAPKDGQAIILWPYDHYSIWDGASIGEVVCGFYSKDDDEWNNPEERRKFNPTHWMPLPSPPETTP